MPDYEEFSFVVTDRPVAAVTCKACGVAIILHETLDAIGIHDAWHASLAPRPRRYIDPELHRGGGDDVWQPDA